MSRAGRIAAELARRSLLRFTSDAWHVIEPTRPLLPSIAFTALCAALDAVGRGKLQRLAVICPPGVSKSLIGAVAFPAWLLFITGGRARVMCGSYSWSFAERDSRRCRELIASPWYQSLVNGAWDIKSTAADRVDDFSSSMGGRRLIVSVGGKALGERCTFQVVDDALSGSDTYSPSAKAEAARWISEVLPSRCEDPEHDPRVIIGQRLATDDPLSVAIAQGFSVLQLPALLADGDAPCELHDDTGALIWRDPREPGAGEPLLSLLGVDALQRLKLELGSAAFSAQYMCKPHDDSSAMFKRAWLTRRWTELPTQVSRTVIALDASFKAGSSSDYAVIQCWMSKGADRFLVEQWRRQAGFADTLEALKEMIARHPSAKVLLELAANGHAIYEQLRAEVPSVFGVKPHGDSKLGRASSVQAIVEGGAVVLPSNAPWVDAWIDEVTSFGAGSKRDDVVDAMVYALRELQTSGAGQLIGAAPILNGRSNGPISFRSRSSSSSGDWERPPSPFGTRR